MDSAFDDVRFLAGSSNRVDVLGALMSGPMTRDGLPRGVIESDDEVVCQWARDTFEQWRADASVLER